MSDQCTKTKFANEKAALDYVRRLKNTSTRSIIPTRAYLCPYCETWHLTSHGSYSEKEKRLQIIIDKRNAEIEDLKKKLDVKDQQFKRLNTLHQANSEKLLYANRKIEQMIRENLKKGGIGL